MWAIGAPVKPGVAYLSALLCLLVASSYSSSHLASAQAGGGSSVISARVCQAADRTSIDEVQPSSDTVVRQRTFNITGQASLATQIEFYLDGTYVKTAAIAAGSRDFSATLDLGQGTNTIRLEAIDICGGSPVSRTIVITYQPSPVPDDAAPPSTGSDVPTASNPNVVAPGGVVVSQPDDAEDDPKGSDDQPQQPGIIGNIKKHLRDWRLDSPDQTSESNSPPKAVGVAVALTGTALMATGGLVGFHSSVASMSVGSRRLLDGGIRSLGALLVVLYILLWL